jgi:3'(2'), 5'-bisphosphate nucleotidase
MMFDIDEIDLPGLCQIAQLAGDEVMRVYNAQYEVYLKEDLSPVTQADLLADQVIQKNLNILYPEYAVISEESDFKNSSQSEVFFLVDPLDGTKEFINKNGEFTVNIALVCKTEVVASVVFAPAFNELYFASKTVGAWKKNATDIIQLKIDSSKIATPLKVIGSRSHADKQVTSWLESMNIDCTHAVLGSSLKFCRIAEGASNIYPRFGPTRMWDTAAGHFILKMAGGAVVDLQGRELSYAGSGSFMNPGFVALSSMDLFESKSFDVKIV